jgi:hypothetical protein
MVTEIVFQSISGAPTRGSGAEAGTYDRNQCETV